MSASFIDLGRTEKPRAHGVTSLIDPGHPTALFCDVIQSHAPLIDMVKFGWGTSLVTKDIQKKAAALRKSGIPFHVGGTLYERFHVEGRIDRYTELVRGLGAQWVEISDGTIELDAAEKARAIAALSRDFKVLSEVGYKDVERSLSLSPKRWIEKIAADLSAGASYVILEARESGTSGICRENGEVRFGLIEEILDSGLDPKRVIFEAPNKKLQVYFVKRVGANVNLGNVAFLDVVGVETLRRGLRADTFRADLEPHRERLFEGLDLSSSRPLQ
jgi:phosphosulfolactate synthase